MSVSISCSYNCSEIQFDTNNHNALFGNPGSMMRLSERTAEFKVSGCSSQTVEKVVQELLSQPCFECLKLGLVYRGDVVNFRLTENFGSQQPSPSWYKGEVDGEACGIFQRELQTKLREAVQATTVAEAT